MYAALRDHDPVHHVEDGDHWVLSRFDDVWAAARDTARFSSAQGLSTAYGELDHLGLAEAAPMVMLDPPDHTEFRRHVFRAFTPRRVAEVADDVRAFVRDRLDELADPAGGDLIEVLAKPLASYVVAHYLGVPAADRRRFAGWTEAIVAANAAGDPLAAPQAVGELFEYFSELMERRRSDPGDDTVSALVGVDGTGVAPLRILGFAFTMVAGGNDTVTGLLGGAAELLTTAPDQRARLLEDPGLVPNAVEEVLRLTTPAQGLARTLTEDVTIRGTTLPAGRKVLLLYASANRDPREFGPDAEVFDVTRHIDRHLAFSHGAHHCLGAAVARLEGRVVVEELLARHPDFVVDPEAGTFAPGSFVRRYEALPFRPTGAGSGAL